LVIQNDGLLSKDISRCVSVIIPTRNSAKTIGKCLESIRNQTYDNIEIIVIDSFSSDNTVEVSAKFGANVLLLSGERARAKNFGISNARGFFLLFVDSDMILEQSVIEDCVRRCHEDERIGGIIIPERSVGSGFWVKVRDLERSLYAGSKIESARFFVTKYATRVNGFDEGIIFYEESTLPQKIESIGRIVDARIRPFILHDEEGFNLRTWLKKKRYYSGTTKSYSNKYRKYATVQTSILYRAQLFLANGNWKILARHPILGVGVFILKTLEFLYSRRLY
jgi:glycosyltransferase involved in cell wall biosynthesis